MRHQQKEMGWGRSPPGWFRCQSGLAWDCFKTRSRNAVPEVSGPCTCYLPSVERPFKDVWASVLKSIVLNPIQIPTSRNSTKAIVPQTLSQPLLNLRHFQSPPLPRSCGLRQTLLTADFKIQTDSLAQALPPYSCLWTAWHSVGTDLAPQETFRILYHKP